MEWRYDNKTPNSSRFDGDDDYNSTTVRQVKCVEISHGQKWKWVVGWILHPLHNVGFDEFNFVVNLWNCQFWVWLISMDTFWPWEIPMHLSAVQFCYCRHILYQFVNNEAFCWSTVFPLHAMVLLRNHCRENKSINFRRI